MRGRLFRDEVILARQGEWLGSIRLQSPRPGWLFFGFGLFCVVAIVALLIGGHYTRHEQVDGSLVPSDGLLTVMPAAPGVVTRVWVHEGDNVRQGQPLLEISGEQDSATLGSTHAAIATQLQVKRDRLQADLAEHARLSELREQDLRGRLNLLSEQIAQVSQQIVLQTQRANSSMSLYQQWATLENTGVVSKLQLLQQHDTALQNQLQLKSLTGQKAQLQQQAEQWQSELAQLPLIAEAKSSEIKRQLADVAQSLSQNAAQSALILHAPAEGIVTTVLVHKGQSVASQQFLMTVLPANSQLLAELWVPSHAIGFVRAGEPVVIRYPAYPYQKFGQHMGRVQDVSRSAVLPAELSRLRGQEAKEPQYRVQVALDKQSVLAYGREEPLKPGMVLHADILMDRRRLIEWVTDPFSGFAQSNSVATAQVR